MKQSDKILVLGGTGMVGSAIVRELNSQGYSKVLSPGRSELDLLNQQATLEYFKTHSPDYVILAAAKVGGIKANDTYRADFIFQNLQIEVNVFNACFKTDVDNLLFLGSSCIYPKEAPQPLKEEYLLTGELEQTNEPYAIAKIAGLKMAENFRRQYGKNYFSVMPTNLYGQNDNYDPETAHAIPGLIARMQDAIDNDEPEFKVWGSGAPRREFLYVDDLAKACIHILKNQPVTPFNFVNIGTGKDITIKELAELIADKMGFAGKLVFDPSAPDGTMRKLLDVSKITEMGWSPETNLLDGIAKAVDFYRKELGR